MTVGYPTAPSPAQTEQELSNINAFTRIHEEIINTGDVSSLAELMAPDVIMRRLGFETTGKFLAPGGMRPPGDVGVLEGFARGLTNLRAAFPDYTHKIDHIFAKDDWVAGRWTLTCTHLGPFMGLAPTGKQIRLEEAGIMRFVEGKLVDGWFLADELTFIAALGVEIKRPI